MTYRSADADEGNGVLTAKYLKAILANLNSGEAVVADAILSRGAYPIEILIIMYKALFILFLLSASVIAEADSTHGIKAYRARNLAQAEAQLLPLAKAGDATAQFYLGSVYLDYYRGMDRNRSAQQRTDLSSAEQWLSKSARQGDARAQTTLAGLYQNDKKYAQAIEWFQRAAESGDASAYTSLGFMYQEGQGVTPNQRHAFEWYMRGAKAGDSSAQGTVGDAYRWGRGVGQDNEQAVSWYTKCVLNEYGSDPYSYHGLWEMFDSGLASDQSYLVALILQAKLQRFLNSTQLSGDEMERAAMALDESRNALSQGRYSNFMAHDPESVAFFVRQTQDREQSLGEQIWPDLNEKGRANFILGMLYERGILLSKADPSEAMKYYQVAADLAYPRGSKKLCSVYRHGELGQIKMPSLADAWCAKAKQQSDLAIKRYTETESKLQGNSGK